MAWFLIAFGVMATLHFVYDGIIAPSLRLTLRFRLFTLRDEARAMRADQPDAIRRETYRALEDYINGAIRVLPKANIELVMKAREAFERYPELRAQAQSQQRLIDECQSTEVRDLQRQATEAVNLALLANSGGWFFWVLPVLLALAWFNWMKSLLRDVMFSVRDGMDLGLGLSAS